MSAETFSLPISEMLTPESESQVCEILRSASQNGTPVYPIGGGTSLGLGLPAQMDGFGLQVGGLNKVVDYPARDMTITVGAGITMQKLTELLSSESQHLPIDAPNPEIATLGGLIATNHSGPRRFGQGTMRDHVIGIRAVDGRGNAFAAGGRVVKNVAGYDFCKLLTGSFGTLGVITEVTLKLKPLPAAGAFVHCQPANLEQAEQLLAAMIDSATTPNLIELLGGSAWSDLAGNDAGNDAGNHAGIRLVVGFEGTQIEVDWMVGQIQQEWSAAGVESVVLTDREECDSLYHRLVEFPSDDSAAMVVKVTGVPSGTTRCFEALRAKDPHVSIQAHAGNGVLIGKFPEYPGGMSDLKAVAAAVHGSATILSNPAGFEMTRHNVWGVADVPFDVMKQVKETFDPDNILNPGRFVY